MSQVPPRQPPLPLALTALPVRWPRGPKPKHASTQPLESTVVLQSASRASCSLVYAISSGR